MKGNKMKVKFNIICTILLHIVTFASGLILPRLLIQKYGSDVNGLVSSISQFLGFITLGEMGIGAVIQYNLYYPLSIKDWKKVSEIITSAKRFFNRLLLGIFIYVFILCIIFSIKMKNNFDLYFIISLIICLSLNSFVQYYLGMAYRQLLDAELLSYIRLLPQITAIIINIIVCRFLILNNYSIQTVKLCTSILYMLQPFVIYIYIKIYFPQVKTVKLNSEPIQQKWNGLAQHIAGVVMKDTDIVVLTFFSTLDNISIYSIYYMIIYGIETIFESVITNFTSVFGKMFASKNKKNEITQVFTIMEILVHMTVTTLFLCIGNLIVPFIRIYTKDICDINYIVPEFAVLLVIAHAFYCIRLPYHIMIKAVGHYKQTQKAAIIESVINILVSVIVVHKLGLIGVAIGTLLAMIYKNIYYYIYLHNNILNYSYLKCIKVFLCDIIVILISQILLNNLKLESINYISWTILAIKETVITLIVTIFIFGIFNFKLFKKYLKGVL